jgi:hypothetical protein
MLAIGWTRNGGLKLRDLAILAFTFTLACGLPNFLVALLYLSAGHWDAYWYANFGFLGRYASNTQPLPVVFHNILASAAYLWPLLLTLFLATTMVVTRRKNLGKIAPIVAWIGLWILAEAAAASATLQFFGHYYLSLLPPLCVVSGVLFWFATEHFVMPSARRVASLLPAVVLALVPVVPHLYAHWMLLGRPDAVARAAAVLRDRLGPEETIYVVNSEPALYFLARARLPTAVPFPPHLLWNQEHVSPVDPDTEIMRILAMRPRYVIIDRVTLREIRPAAAAVVTRELAEDYELQSTHEDAQQLIELYRLKG